MIRTVLALVLLSLVPVLASAAPSTDATVTAVGPVLQSMNREEYLAFHRRLAGSPKFAVLSTRDRRTIQHEQRRIDALLADEPSMDTLNERERIALFNAHEHIVAVLNDDLRSRMVCQRRAPVGTHIKVTECRTVAERDRMLYDFMQTYLRKRAARD